MYLNIGIIIWLLLGIVAIWRVYHGCLKWWYNIYKESYWKSNNNMALKTLLGFSPIFIIGGGVTLLLFELTLKPSTPCWWFTTKNK